MWQINLTPLENDILGELEPTEVLFGEEEPYIFTVTNLAGDLLLVYLCAQDTQKTRYLAVATAKHVIAQLKSGEITVRDALASPWVWIVESTFAGARTTWRVDPSSLPEANLPTKGTMLYPHLEPSLALRLIGPTLGRGSTPLSVVRHAVTGIERALATIAGAVQQQGRRSSYNLPTHSFAFNSFEIVLGHPDAKQSETMETVGLALSSGLAWVQDSNAALSARLPNEAQQLAVLQALKALAPSLRGVVDHTEVRGLILGSQRVFSLTREHHRRVRGELVRMRPELRDDVENTGRIGQIDFDQYFFVLREVDGLDGTEIKIYFEEEDLDDIVDAGGARIRVTYSELATTRCELISMQAIPD